MIKNIDDFTSKDKIGSFEDRIKFYNENEYRFKDGMHIFDDVIKPGINNLAQLKLYLTTGRK